MVAQRITNVSYTKTTFSIFAIKSGYHCRLVPVFDNVFFIFEMRHCKYRISARIDRHLMSARAYLVETFCRNNICIIQDVSISLNWINQNLVNYCVVLFWKSRYSKNYILLFTTIFSSISLPINLNQSSSSSSSILWQGVIVVFLCNWETVQFLSTYLSWESYRYSFKCSMS